jgi:hypothetical protein
MNKLDDEAVTKLSGTSKNTVLKLMIDAGKACAAYHAEHARKRRCQVNEIGVLHTPNRRVSAAPKPRR